MGVFEIQVPQTHEWKCIEMIQLASLVDSCFRCDLVDEQQCNFEARILVRVQKRASA